MTREKNMRKFLLTGASFAFLVGFFQANDAHSEGKEPVQLVCYVNGQVQVIQKPVLVTLCYNVVLKNNLYCSDGKTAKDALAACQAAFPGAVTTPTLPSSVGCPIVGYDKSAWQHNLCIAIYNSLNREALKKN
jgi:hypothetical protein